MDIDEERKWVNEYLATNLVMVDGEVCLYLDGRFSQQELSLMADCMKTNEEIAARLRARMKAEQELACTKKSSL